MSKTFSLITGEEKILYKKNTNEISRVTFDPDGKTLKSFAQKGLRTVYDKEKDVFYAQFKFLNMYQRLPANCNCGTRHLYDTNICLKA